MPEPISESAHHRPAGPLDGLIAAYDGYRQRGVPPARHLGLPSPYLTLILALDEPLELARRVDPRLGPGRFPTLIGGLHSRPVVICHDGAQSGIQLSVTPLASRALFGVSAGELAGQDLPAEEVLGRVATELAERVAEAPDWSGRFRVLNGALTRMLAGEVATGPPPPVHAAWARLVTAAGDVPIAALARDVGWSERQLEKVFAREIGMSPKQAARVIRFDRVRRTLQQRRRAGCPLELARLAADRGYSDQSHLIRDFRAFTGGLAPTAWLAAEFGNVQVTADAAT